MKQEKKDEQYQSYMVASGKYRAGLFILFIFTLAAFSFVIWHHNIKDQGNWTQLLAPLIFIGVPLMLYPATKVWVYNPWQARPSKYERHYKD